MTQCTCLFYTNTSSNYSSISMFLYVLYIFSSCSIPSLFFNWFFFSIVFPTIVTIHLLLPRCICSSVTLYWCSLWCHMCSSFHSFDRILFQFVLRPSNYLCLPIESHYKFLAYFFALQIHQRFIWCPYYGMAHHYILEIILIPLDSFSLRILLWFHSSNRNDCSYIWIYSYS